MHMDIKNNKFAWTWYIKQDVLDDYINMHLNAWPDVLQAHTEAGIQNYSIFQNGNQFFYCFECDNISAAFRYLENNEACRRWNALTSKMVEGSFDFSKDEPIKPMRQVFYLK